MGEDVHERPAHRAARRMRSTRPPTSATLENYLAGKPTDGRTRATTRRPSDYFDEVQAQAEGSAATRSCSSLGSSTRAAWTSRRRLHRASRSGPGRRASSPGDGLYTPSAASSKPRKTRPPPRRPIWTIIPGALGNPLHTLRVLFGLFFLVVLPGLIASNWFELEDTPSRIGLIPGISIALTLLSGIALLAVWRGPLTTTKAWTAVALATLVALALRVGKPRLQRVLASFGGFFNTMFSVFSNRAYATLVGVQFLVQAGQGVIQGAFAKSIAFGGEKGFDVTVVPSARYLLKVVLALYVPYTLVSPFIGVVIDRFERRKILSLSNIITAIVVSVVAVAAMLPLGKDTSEGNVGATVALIVGLLFIQACVRVALAVKSAAIPDVLSGKDLLQGNGVSQAGGALFQVVGIGFAFGFAAVFPSWMVVVGGAGVLIAAAFVAKRLERMEASPHEATFGQEAKQVVKNIVAGLKEVKSRPPAALGLSLVPDAALPVLGLLSLHVRSVREEPGARGERGQPGRLGLVGGGGFLGGALGLVLAQKWKDRVPPIRLLLALDGRLGPRGDRLRWVRVVARVRRAAVHRLLHVLPGQDLGRHDHAADDAGRFPRPRVRAVRHRVQRRLHRAGVDPVVPVGGKKCHEERAGSSSHQASCSSCLTVVDLALGHEDPRPIRPPGRPRQDGIALNNQLAPGPAGRLTS